MPLHIDAEVGEFRTDTIMGFFEFVTGYANSLGMKNVVNPIPQILEGFTTNDGRNKYQKFTIERLLSVPHIDNVGTDPYWLGSTEPPYNPYERIYNIAKNCVEVSNNYSKDNHLWIQGFGCPSGREEEIIVATEAAYDSGARTILSWGFHGCESNTYRSHNPARAWNATVEGMKRIKSFERDRILAENRRKFMK